MASPPPTTASAMENGPPPPVENGASDGGGGAASPPPPLAMAEAGDDDAKGGAATAATASTSASAEGDLSVPILELPDGKPGKESRQRKCRYCLILHLLICYIPLVPCGRTRPLSQFSHTNVLHFSLHHFSLYALFLPLSSIRPPVPTYPPSLLLSPPLIGFSVSFFFRSFVRSGPFVPFPPPPPPSVAVMASERRRRKKKRREGGRPQLPNDVEERRGEANGHGGHRVICLLQGDTPGSPFRRSLGGSACLRRLWRLSPSPTRLRRGRRRFPFRPSFVVWSCLSWNSDIFMREEMSLSVFPSASPRGSFSSPAAVLPEKRGRKKREAPFFPSPLFSRL